jgi:hypothetical protein
MDGFYYKKAKKYNYVPYAGICKADFTHQLENRRDIYPTEELHSYSPEEKKQDDGSQNPCKSYRKGIAAPYYICCIGYVCKYEGGEYCEELEQGISANLKV